MLTNINDLSLQRPTWAEIDLDALHSNYLEIRRTASNSRILAVVKSDAYGHGATRIARELQEAGVDFFGTATAQEAIGLRQAGIRGTLILLSGIFPQQIPLLDQYDLIPSVSSQDFLNALSHYASARQQVSVVHLEVDTGMGRLGFAIEEAETILRNPPPFILIDGIFTHFATADVANDAYTRTQLDRFLNFIRGKSIPCVHIANSAGILNYSSSHLELVRPGLLLYGISPISETSQYRPILSLKSKIILLHRLAKGETIGYGRTFRATRDSLIATVPFGYADGLRRRLSNRLRVEVQETMCPIAGTISMDLCMIDVTDIQGRIQLYDLVTFIGPKTTAWDWANLLDTIPYEITCLIGARVPRVYYKGGQIFDVYYP